MERLGLPYGTLPTTEQFLKAFLYSHYPDHPIRFRKDARLGSCNLTAKEFWQEIKRAHRDDTQESTEWCKRQLASVSIVWC